MTYATYEDLVAGTRSAPVHPILEEFSGEDVLALYQTMSPEEQEEFDLLLSTAPSRVLMPHQVIPWDNDLWEIFMLIGGRGTGKTVTGARGVRDLLRMQGKEARIGIGAPTNSDARDICMEGETGLITMFPNEFIYYNRSQLEARHVDGGFVKAMGTEKPARWNGPQWSGLWIDEVSLCNRHAIDQANMGLRIKAKGIRPRSIYTCTPKNKKWVKEIAQELTTLVPQYRNPDGSKRLPTTFDNKYLPQERVDWLDNKYGGSRVGRQELLGEFIDDVEGAMWDRKWFRHETDPSKWPRFMRIVVAIDPAGSAPRKTADQNSLTEEQRQNQQKNAETAIAVVGLGSDGLIYILNIKSGHWTPKEWGMEALRMYHIFRADKIVAEKNFGGLMVEGNIRNIDEYDKRLQRRLIGRNVPIKLVTASRGKDVRAEPVSTLYEQRRVVHCANFVYAEDQMCSFVDAEDNEGADMVDAVVWGVTEVAGLDLNQGRIMVIPDRSPLTALVIR